MGLTMKEQNSVAKEIAERYRHSDRKAKKYILNEYILLTEFHRKYAIAKLNSCIKRREHSFNNCTMQTTIEASCRGFGEFMLWTRVVY